MKGADLNFPVIDMGPVIAGEAGAQGRAGEQVRRSFETTAFFFIKNHGIGQAMMDGIIEQSRRFHGQDLDQKMKVKVGPELHGYLPPGGQIQRSSRYNDNVKPELSASFYIRRDYPEGHPDLVAGKPWAYLNKWPDEASLPGYKQALLDYFDALEGVFLHVMPPFAVALGLPANYFNESEAFDPPNPTLRLLEYLPQDPAAENVFGIGPHADFGCVTILHQGPSPGLEVLVPSGEWVAPPMMDGHFLVNTGQLLERWANDRIPATPHRVRNLTGELRHSAAFLIAPRKDVTIETLACCIDVAHPNQYEPITYGEHIAAIRAQNYEIPDNPKSAREFGAATAAE